MSHSKFVLFLIFLTIYSVLFSKIGNISSFWFFSLSLNSKTMNVHISHLQHTYIIFNICMFNKNNMCDVIYKNIICNMMIWDNICSLMVGGLHYELLLRCLCASIQFELITHTECRKKPTNDIRIRKFCRNDIEYSLHDMRLLIDWR